MKKIFFITITLFLLLTNTHSQEKLTYFRIINGKLYSQVFMKNTDIIGYDFSIQASKKIDKFSYGVIGGINWFEEFSYFPVGVSAEYEFLEGKTLPTFEIIARYSFNNDTELESGINLNCNIGIKRSFQGKREKPYYVGIKTGIEFQYLDYVNREQNMHIYLPIKVHFDF